MTEPAKHLHVDKRLRWFDEGAPMLRLVLERFGARDALPERGDYYACPCCLTVYPREAVAARILTEEHVPPKRLGGRGLLLTCKNCNDNSGSSFDSHAVTRSHADDFARGRVSGHALPATAQVDDIPFRGTIEWTDGGIQMFGVREQNDPREAAAHFAALDAYAESGNPNPNHSFTVHTRFDETRARLSWIRAAYLAAFAALGWSYILRATMEPFRAQFKQPSANILPTYILRDPDTSPTERRLLLVTQPDDLRCVAVVIGGHTVFLPGLFHTLTCNELVETFARRRDAGDRLNIQLNGKEVPWPKWPTYVLDRPATE